MSYNYNIPIKLNFPRIPFRTAPVVSRPQIKSVNDSFVSNPIYDKLATKEQIEETINSNPRIKEILAEHNLPVKINLEELNKLKLGHLNDTRVVAAKIYSSLPEELKKNSNLAHIQEAAMLHDFGKVLIPNSILSKAGKLNPEELSIMKLHSELSYELLKNKGLSDDTLNLIKYHHQNLNGNGYPAKNDGYKYGIENEIISVADKYSALREKRSYKNPLGKYEALEIIAKEVNKGNISQNVYTALLKSV